MDSNRSSCSVICCGNCNKNLHIVYTFPCKHLFCLECTNKMKKGSETTCITCSKKCHQDEIKIQESINQFGSLRSEYSGDSRSLVSLHSDEVVVDKTAQKLFCSRHNEDIKIYCEDCDVIVCNTCCILNHSDHVKSDEQEKVIAKSTSDINIILSKIDNVIMNKNNLVDIEINCLKNYEKVRTNIRENAAELKKYINEIKESTLEKINAIEKNMVESVRNELKESNDCIDLMIEKRAFYTNAIKNNLNIDPLSLQHDLNTIKVIQEKPPKEVYTTELFFQKPSYDEIFLTEISKSFDFYVGKGKLELKNFTASSIVVHNNLYTAHCHDNLIIIDIYDMFEMTYKNSIKFNPNFETIINDVWILNTQTYIFIYCRQRYSNHTHVFRLKENTSTFVKIKTFEEKCGISATFQQTLLVRIKNRKLLELSADGVELKTIKIPIEADLPLPYHFTTDHQLKDLRYIVTSFNLESYQISLLEADGTFIKSFTQQSTSNIATCTDGENNVIVFERDVGKITVLSTDLQSFEKVESPEVLAIHYDKRNDQVLLIKENEIIYIKVTEF